MRAVAVAGESSVEEAVALARKQPAMAGRALVADVSTTEPYVYAPDGRVARRRRRLRRQELVLRRLAEAGAAVTVYPHDVDADELAGYDGVSCSPGPGDPEPLVDEAADGARAARADARARHLPRPPAARASRPATRRSSSRSATAARTTPCSSGANGRVLVTSQNHGFAVRADRRGGGDARLALRRHGRGARVPRAARPLAPVPPGGGPGPARRVAAARALGRRGGHAVPQAHRHRVDLHRRLRPDRDRAGGGVRLRRLPGAEGAARGRLPHDRRQLEPGDDHDRPRLRRPHVPRAARRRGRLGRAAPRAAATRCCRRWAADRAQPRPRARRAGILDELGDRADRRTARRDPARRGPAALQGGGRVAAA